MAQNAIIRIGASYDTVTFAASGGTIDRAAFNADPKNDKHRKRYLDERIAETISEIMGLDRQKDKRRSRRERKFGKREH